MVIVKILVILFLVVLFVLGFRVVFSKNDETKKSGGGVTASDSKSEKQENHENN